MDANTDHALLPLDSGWIAQAPFVDDARPQLALRFHLRAISKAKDFAQRHSIHMSYIFIPVPQPCDSLYERINAEYCKTHGIDFFSLRPALHAIEHAGQQIYLPHDGHFSATGVRVTAEALVEHFHLPDPQVK